MPVEFHKALIESNGELYHKPPRHLIVTNYIYVYGDWNGCREDEARVHKQGEDGYHQVHHATGQGIKAIKRQGRHYHFE